MNEPLFHPRTEVQLRLYLKHPSHGLVLIGEEGSGKVHAATWLAQQMQSELRVVDVGEKQSMISIEQIRNLYTQTKTGRPQTILIKDAHTMSKEAQNAFLKLLEEPPQQTHFILSAQKADSLLPTIRSRAQLITLTKPTTEQFQTYFNNTSAEFTQLLHITKRAAGAVATALTDQDHKAAIQTSMGQAKQFYQADHYSRHQYLISIAYEKTNVSTLLDNLTTIVSALIKAKSDSRELLRKLTEQASLLEKTKTVLTRQAGNPKIHLTKLAEML